MVLGIQFSDLHSTGCFQSLSVLVNKEGFKVEANLFKLLARMIGPILGGQIYVSLGHAAPAFYGYDSYSNGNSSFI